MRSSVYGRRLDDFHVGAVLRHPWEVTVDEGAVALWHACFLDATPVYASSRVARMLGHRARPVPPMLLLNYALGLSVHDVSEQAVAHLAYLDVRFPHAAYPGDTLRAESRVLGARRASGDRGVVHVATQVVADDGRAVCALERKVLVRAGSVGRATATSESAVPEHSLLAAAQPPAVPPPVPVVPEVASFESGFGGFAEDFAPGDVLVHDAGRTVSEAEHMQLTWLCKNTHPLHTDERYAKEESFASTRVVCGGLVLAWAMALASRDTAGEAVWEMKLDAGAHPNGVVAGDTLYAASKVLAVDHRDASSALVTFRLVGSKNVPTRELVSRGVELFTPELSKEGAARIAGKVLEIDRTVLVRRRR